MSNFERGYQPSEPEAEEPREFRTLTEVNEAYERGEISSEEQQRWNGAFEGSSDTRIEPQHKSEPRPTPNQKDSIWKGASFQNYLRREGEKD